MPYGNCMIGVIIMKKLRSNLYKVPLYLLLLFSLFIWRLTLKSRFGNTLLFHQFKNESIQIITMLIGVLFFSIAIAYLCKIIENLPIPKLHFTIKLFFFLLIILQVIWYCFISRPLPTTDTATLIEQALAMVKTQNGQLNTKLPYFQHYSNNYCFVMLLYYFYSFLAFFHITDVWLPTIILNVVFIDLGIFLTYKTAKKLSNEKKATVVLLLCLLCPTTYVWEGFTYTNTCSIPFIMGLLYLFLCLQDAKLCWRTCIQLILFGSLLVFGILIRSTTILPMIAMIVTSCLKLLATYKKSNTTTISCSPTNRILRNTQQFVTKATVLLITISLSLFAWNYIKSAHIPAVDKDNTFPATHWIMMGTKDFGKFDREDVLYTSSFPTYEEKINGNLSLIKKRLSSLNARGYYTLCYNKLYSVWGDGSDECIVKSKSSFYYPPLYNYVLGNKNLFFAFYMQVFRSCMFLFLLFEIFRSICIKKMQNNYVFLLTILGCIMFFLLWEANPKYNICFNYIILLLMVDGVYAFRSIPSKLQCLLGKHQNKNKRLFRLVMLTCCTLSILILSVEFVTQYKSFTQTKDTYLSLVNYTEKKHVSVMKGLKNKGDIIEQTFTCNQPFNRIKLYLKECVNESTNENYGTNISANLYQIKLLSTKNNQVLYDKAIGLSDIHKKKGTYTIKLPKTFRNNETTEYKIQIQCNENTTNTLGLYYKNIQHLTSYSYGKLTVNQLEYPFNLYIQIFEKERRTYTNEVAYLLVFFGILVFLLQLTRRTSTD